jgi:hypothetical protein
MALAHAPRCNAHQFPHHEHEGALAVEVFEEDGVRTPARSLGLLQCSKSRKSETKRGGAMQRCDDTRCAELVLTLSMESLSVKWRDKGSTSADELR